MRWMIQTTTWRPPRNRPKTRASRFPPPPHCHPPREFRKARHPPRNLSPAPRHPAKIRGSSAPPLDACRFFGPLLSLIVVAQICASILISRQLEGSITEMTSTAVAAIIMAAFLFTDVSFLIYLRGRHFEKFTPWLAGLLLVSVCICIGLVAWNSTIFSTALKAR